MPSIPKSKHGEVSVKARPYPSTHGASITGYHPLPFSQIMRFSRWKFMRLFSNSWFKHEGGGSSELATLRTSNPQTKPSDSFGPFPSRRSGRNPHRPNPQQSSIPRLQAEIVGTAANLWDGLSCCVRARRLAPWSNGVCEWRNDSGGDYPIQTASGKFPSFFRCCGGQCLLGRLIPHAVE